MGRKHPRNDEGHAAGAKDPREVARLPVDPRTGEPIPPRLQPGYYPGHSTLDQAAFWDEATRKEVLHRVNNVPPIRFFTPEEAALARAVFARVLPQDDRDPSRRVPIVEHVDLRLYAGRTDGYRYEDMPDDREAYRRGLPAIDAVARKMFQRGFLEIGPGEQDAVLETLLLSESPAAHEIFEDMNVSHFWKMLVNDAVEVYYAHPWAWDEIGFGGPAYPRGYMRLTQGQAEPWEKPEKRYEWAAPPGSRSDRYRPLEKTTQSGHSGKGQGGSH